MIRKTAVIFGASGDIGKEVARKFAQNGYNLGLTYFNTNIDKFAKELEKKYKINVLVQRVDARKSDEVENAIKSFEKELKIINIGVLAFGIADKQSLLTDKSDEQLRNVIETNLLGTLFVTRELCRVMLKRKSGSIVNISSIIGTDGASCESAYASSKAGMIGLTKSLAKEFGEFGIRINSVSPGFIDTKMCSCFNKKDREAIKENTLLSRLGTVEDVAEMVYFIASENSSFVTGQNIVVSGGLRV